MPLIAFVAFVLKAMAGFGPAIIVVSFGALLVPPRSIVATSAILDLVAGLILLRIDRARGGYRYWAPLAVAIVGGGIIGATFLKVIPAALFRRLLAIAICILGAWFILGRTRSNEPALADALPDRCSRSDGIFTFVGGFFGGLLGISGPPIIWHFGRRFSKEAFRRILIPLFAVEVFSRTVAYSALGVVDFRVLTYVAAALPGLLIGLYVGNKMFFTLSETFFSRIVGVVLLIVSIRILL